MALGSLQVLISIFAISVIAVMHIAYLRSVGGDEMLANRSEKRQLVFNGTDHLEYHSTSMKDCQKVRFADPPLPITILASSPGSGNTWVRHLLQQATGFLTGSVFYDVKLLSEFPAEGVVNGSVVVVKAHNARSLNRVRKCSRVILLVRNPFKAIFSDFHRTVTKGNHTGIAQEEISENEKITSDLTMRWYRMTDSWLEQWTGPLLVISYENLEKDTRAEMKKVLDFLQLKVSKANFSCMLRNSEGKFHRRPTPLKPNMFSDVNDMKRRLTFYLNEVNKKLVTRFGIRIHNTIPSELQQLSTLN